MSLFQTPWDGLKCPIIDKGRCPHLRGVLIEGGAPLYVAIGMRVHVYIDRAKSYCGHTAKSLEWY